MDDEAKPSAQFGDGSAWIARLEAYQEAGRRMQERLTPHLHDPAVRRICDELTPSGEWLAATIKRSKAMLGGGEVGQ